MSRRSTRMVSWIGVGAAALLFAVSLRAGHSQGPDPLTAGKDAFLENCAACHNASHRVGPPLATDMGYFIRAGVPAQAMGGMLVHAVRNRPAESRMPSFAEKDLSDADAANIALYLGSQTKAPDAPVTLGTPEKGQWMYSVACASCHGDQGEGKGHAPALAAMMNGMKAMKAPPNMALGMVMLATRSGSLRMPTFPAPKLTDDQLKDIAAYIWSFPPPPPTAAPPKEGAKAEK